MPEVETGPMATYNAMKQFFTEAKENTTPGSAIADLLTHKETLGVGMFGRVRLVEVSKLKSYLEDQMLEGAPYVAMKIIKKTEVVRLKQAEHVKNEVTLLSAVTHPFIVNMYSYYMDERNVYVLEEYVPCGQLFKHIEKNGKLTNEASRFYAAQLVMAIQYLHSEGIVYRDLNPENVLLDASCYLKLVDFGYAKKMDLENPAAKTWTLCGTPEYLAPEIIQSKGHGKDVDWWALGILMHEMLAGYPPYYDENPFQIYQQILKGNLEFPRHFEQHCRDLIKKLLSPKEKRIGSHKSGAEDIKKHKWYRGLNWAALYNKRVETSSVLAGLSHIPAVSTPHDTSNYESYPNSSDESGPMLDSSIEAELFKHW